MFCQTEANLKESPRLTELRNTAQKMFVKPTVREKWTAELGGPVEFAPSGEEVTLREKQTSTARPGAQRVVRLQADGRVEPANLPDGRYVARGDGVELSWTSTSKYVHDPMCPSVDNMHRDVVLKGPNFSRALPDCDSGEQQSPYRWAPVTGQGRILVQTSARTIECLDQDGNLLFAHEGTPWSSYGTPPVIGPDGRVIITDGNHNTLTAYRPDGTTAWQRSLFKNIRCAPLPLEDGTTLVATQCDQNGVTSLRRLDEAGEQMSEVRLPGSFVNGLAQAPDGTWLVATNDKPNLSGYDAAWQLRWEHPLPEPTVGHPRVQADGSIVLIGKNGHVTSLEVTDPRTAPQVLTAEETSGGEIREAPGFINVAGVRIRRHRR